MNKQDPVWLRYAVAIAFLSAVLGTALLPRNQWPEIMGTYLVAFVMYFIVLVRRQTMRAQWQFWLGVGIAARILMLFCFPNLSDDIYRFIWDGQLTMQGINPYDILPSNWIQTEGLSDGLYPTLYTYLNSPEYYTIYPPIGQGLFAIASWIGGADWNVFALVLKMIFLCTECLTLRVMYLILKPLKREAALLMYALNPLVILELTGNLHLEAIMILGLVLTVYFLSRKKLAGVAAGFALGIGAKLLPAMLVPFLLRRMSLRQFVVFAVLLAGMCSLIFLPMLQSDFLQGAGSSVNMYFQKFEFNACFYYIGRWVGYLVEGYNPIATVGPLLAGITVMILTGLLSLERKPEPDNFARVAVLALSTYFLLATTVHPWYICTILAMAVFTQFRFPIIWTGVAFLSYSAYRSSSYEENLYLVALEYLLLISWILFEIWDMRKSQSRRA